MKIALLVVFLGGVVVPSVTFAQTQPPTAPPTETLATQAAAILPTAANIVLSANPVGAAGVIANFATEKAGELVEAAFCTANLYKCLRTWAEDTYIAFIIGVMNVCAFILGVAGLLLKVVIEYAVVGMSARIHDIDTINVAWTAFRDLANMAFIFIILYIAIRTILDINGGSTKKMLVNVIIIGLLINFSLFFTKIIIDASNVITIGFYNNILMGANDGGKGWIDTGIAGPFVDKMKLVGIYNKEMLKDFSVINMTLIGLGGSLFFLVAAFVFLAIGFLFIGRFVILVFLMILSPLAFASVALPEDKYSKMWWNKLLDQCIFAPVFMALLWVSFQVLDGILKPSTSTLEKVVTADGLNKIEALPLVMNFIIIIAMLLFCLFVAKQFGAMGASTAMNAGNKIKSWGQGKIRGGAAWGGGKIGRGAVRGLGNVSIEKLDKKLAGSAFGNTAMGRTIRNATTGKATGSRFGSGESVQERNKKDKALNEQYAKDGVKNAERGFDEKVEKDRITRVTKHGQDAKNQRDVASVSGEAASISRVAQQEKEQELEREIAAGNAIPDNELENTKAKIDKHENDMKNGQGMLESLEMDSLKADLARTEQIKSEIDNYKRQASQYAEIEKESNKKAEEHIDAGTLIHGLITNSSKATDEEKNRLYRGHMNEVADKVGGWGESRETLVKALRDAAKGRGEEAELRQVLAVIKKAKEEEAGAGQVTPPKTT